MANSEFELCEPFDIDNGELDGLSRQACFVRGVEWQQFRQLCDRGEPFTKMVHADQRDRLEAVAKRRGIEVEVAWVNDDWIEIRGK